MRIALGSDHHGVRAISQLTEHLRETGHDPVVLGTQEGESWDYPDSAYLVGEAVRRGEADMGVLVCGSAIGMSIAANKIRGVRAGVACDAAGAELTRRHNDANVLCLAGGRCSPDEIVAIADTFLSAPFDGGRHARRLGKIEAIERGEDPTATGGGVLPVRGSRDEGVSAGGSRA